MSKMGQSIIPANPAPQKSPSPDSADGLEDEVTQVYINNFNFSKLSSP